MASNHREQRDSDQIVYEQSDQTAIIRLNRPDRRNALGDVALGQLATAVKRAADTADVRVIVLRGAQGTFSSGLDLRDSSPEAPRAFVAIFQDILHIDKPVVSVVEGMALGGGAALAMVADLRIMARSASIGWPEVRRGVPSTLNAVLLSAMLPRITVTELLLLGALVSADEAASLRLVNWVVGDAELDDKLHSVLADLALGAPLAQAGVKEMLRRLADPLPASAVAIAREILDRVSRSTDCLEGAAAFRERRAPTWRGR